MIQHEFRNKQDSFNVATIKASSKNLEQTRNPSYH